MKFYSVFDKEFKPYGNVVNGLDCNDLMLKMQTIPMPQGGVSYLPSIDLLERSPVMNEFQDSLFGGMPTQLGMCWGYNTKLNCLEYHRDSEFNLGTEDFVLLLAKRDEIKNDILDTSVVKAFKVPAGVLVEVFATALHYAPCHCNSEVGFRVLVALPKGTNTDTPAIRGNLHEDAFMTARNKWLLAHASSDEAKQGAVIALTGENIDIKNSL